MKKIVLLTLLAPVLAVAAAAQPLSTTLAFDAEGLDLETGEVLALHDPEVDAAAADVQIALNADRETYAVVFQADGAEIAVMSDTPFAYVSASDVASLTFTTELVDVACDGDDTAVVRTAGGSVYKIGNLVEDPAAGTVSFDYELLEGPQASLPAAPTSIAETPGRGGESAPGGPSAEAWRAISGAIERDRYAARRAADGELEAANPAQAYRVRFTADGVTVSPRGLAVELGLALTGVGYGDRLRPVAAAVPRAEGQRVEYARGELVEWYVNRPSGLEQGWTLAAPPGARREGEPLRLALAVGGGLSATLAPDGSAVELRDATGRPRLRYAGLQAWDADGRELPAEMTLAGARLGLEVEDIGAVYPVTVDPTILNEDAKLLASEGVEREVFGFSIAMWGSTVVVGSHGDSRSAYVFEEPPGGWAGLLSEHAKLQPSAAGSDGFGFSVAVSGSTVVVGAPLNDDNGRSSGSAYVFEEPVGGWAGTLNESAKLAASDSAAVDEFGKSVGVSGSTVVVGAWLDDDRGSNSGSAYVFLEPPGGWAGTLNESAKLLASDGAPSDQFGHAVGVAGSTVVVGAYLDDDNGLSSGSAYVFEEPAGGWSGTLSQSAKLLPSDGARSAIFGFAVAIADSTVVIGAQGANSSGAAYVFEEPPGGWAGTLAERAKLVASDGAASDFFGFKVATSGTIVAIGAFQDVHEGVRSGSAYAFEEPETGWAGILTESAKLVSSDFALYDHIGYSVGLSGSTVVVGARLDDDRGENSGSAYVFDLPFGNEPPVCSAPAAVASECAGATTTVTGLDGSASSDPDGDALAYSWTTDCPGGVFDDATSPTPVLTVESVAPGVCAPLSCSATLTVSDGSDSDTCAATVVSVDDTLAPVVSVDTTPVTVTDADCSGDEPATLPTAGASDQCDPDVAVGDDAPGSFPAGRTTTVTYSATDDCSNAGSAGVDVTVLFGADIAISASRHTVGAGTFPGSSKEPLVGIEVCAYDKAEGSCSRDVCGGISHQHYGCILDSCEPVNAEFNAACCTTDAEGECTINAPPGDYIVISGDATKTVLPDPLGVSASNLVCGELKQKHLQQIVRSDGRKMPGTTTVSGSELLIIEPEFVEWDETTEPYPVVFESVGTSDAESSVEPPEGFVSDHASLSEHVDNELEAVQFLLTDVGSEWVPTGTRHVLSHGGRKEVVLGRIGVRVSEALAKAKGLDRDGHPLGPDGKAKPHPGFDPRYEWPVEIAGWIEPSAADAGWTLELRVHRATDLELAITRGQGRIVRLLASGHHAPGEHAFAWNGEDLEPGKHFLRLTADELVQKVELLEK